MAWAPAFQQQQQRRRRRRHHHHHHHHHHMGSMHQVCVLLGSITFKKLVMDSASLVAFTTREQMFLNMTAGFQSPSLQWMTKNAFTCICSLPFFVNCGNSDTGSGAGPSSPPTLTEKERKMALWAAQAAAQPARPLRIREPGEWVGQMQLGFCSMRCKGSVPCAGRFSLLSHKRLRRKEVDAMHWIVIGGEAHAGS